MILLMVFLSAVLTIVAAVHLLWALGYWWPIREEAGLARAVLGARGRTVMPGAVACSLVVVALLAAAAWPWFMADDVAPFGRLGGWLIAAVFLARGAAAYLPAWRRIVPEEPFATLDRTVYAPLCLTIGAGFLIVTRSIA